MESDTSETESNPQPDPPHIMSSSLEGSSNTNGLVRPIPTTLEASSITIIPEKLTGDNYREWAHSITLALDGRDKLGYISGETQAPSSLDTKAMKLWKSENSLVSSWLINTMAPNVRKSFRFLPSAREIWEAVHLAYGTTGNISLIFDIKAKLWEVKQKQRSINDYYLEKNDLWQELDFLKDKKHHCTADAAEDHKEKEMERLFEFLAGLDKTYDEIRGRILGHQPLPSVPEAFSILRNEESRRNTMLKRDTPQNLPPVPEVSAMAAQSFNQKNSKGRPTCDHCQKQGHTKDKCWDLHGKPHDWKPKKSRGRGYVAESTKDDEQYAIAPAPQVSSSSNVNLDGDNLNQIMEMLASLQFKNQAVKNPTATVVRRGNFLQALATIKGVCSGQCWIIDSGASDHMTDDKRLFLSYAPVANKLTVKIADDSDAVVAGIGIVKVSATLTLNSVLHVPNLKCNLLSVSKLTKDEHCQANFFADHCSFQDLLTGMMIGSASESNGLYYLDGDLSKNSRYGNKMSLSRTSELELWHQRLGHPNFNYMSKMFPSICSNKDVPFLSCDSCAKAKHHLASYPQTSYRASTPFSTIHSDLWGPSRTPNRTNTKWFITFIDDHTRMSWLYLLKDKTEVCQTFINFHNMVQTQFQTKIKILHTDNGTEYVNHTLSNFLTKNGILHKSTCPSTPQQNGIAERKNRHILETARAIMFESKVPKYYWVDAVLTATFLINRMPSKPLSFKTPLEMLHEHFHLSYLENKLPLKVFGCTCYVYISHSNKLDPRSVRCIFLGYSASQKGYKCFDPLSKRLYVTCDVNFHETTPF